MKYWPLSKIAASPAMPWGFAGQFYNVLVRHDDKFTGECVQAIAAVANSMQPIDMPSMTLVPAVGVPAYRVYLRRPGQAEWEALERAGVLWDHEDLLHLIIAPLH